MEQFQAGASLAGPNPLGMMIKGMLESVNKMRGMQVEQRFKLEQIQEEATAKSQADLAANQELFRTMRQGGERPGFLGGGVITGGTVGGFDVGFPQAQAELAEARARGATAGRPPPGAAKASAAQLQARASLAQLRTVFDEAAVKMPAIADNPRDLFPEGVGAIVGGVGRKFLASTGFNEPARGFLETQVGNARQVIRGLGEVGVLTDKDVADAVRLLPASTDSQTVRSQKLNALERLIESKLQVYESALQMSGGESDVDEQFLQQLRDQGYVVEAVP
jgi:hypothetical protein